MSKVILSSAASSPYFSVDWGRLPPPHFVPIQDEWRGIDDLGPKARAEAIEVFAYNAAETVFRPSDPGDDRPLPARLWMQKTDPGLDYVLHTGAVALAFEDGQPAAGGSVFARKGCLAAIKRRYSLGGRGGRPAPWKPSLMKFMSDWASDEPEAFLDALTEDVIARYQADPTSNTAPLPLGDSKRLRRNVRKLKRKVLDGMEVESKTQTQSGFAPLAARTAK
jgi:hypothetical protein